MGVLTKPDLAIERATQQAVLDLVLGRRNVLKLGYYVLKNRDADDTGSSLTERNLKEKAFFAQDPWAAIAKTGRTGVKAVKNRISDLLDTITKKEFPYVKAEIGKRLTQHRDEQQALGSPRSDSHAQRAYLGRLAANFQRLATCALDANYVHDKIFTEKPEMKLITRIIEVNEGFADTFWQKGHLRKFDSETGSDEEDKPVVRREIEVKVPYDDYPELDGIIIMDPYVCVEPEDDSIMDHIGTVYSNSRGAELGTVSTTVMHSETSLVNANTCETYSSVVLSLALFSRSKPRSGNIWCSLTLAVPFCLSIMPSSSCWRKPSLTILSATLYGMTSCSRSCATSTGAQ